MRVSKGGLLTLGWQETEPAHAKETTVFAVMIGLWLFWTLVGPTASLLLTVPESPIYFSIGDTALLSASLNFSTSVPDYFQLRWHFVTGKCLVLILKADSCVAKTGKQHWRNSCRISVEKTERYRHRAELSSEDASLVLQNVRAEDSGTYSITVLALDVMTLSNISLTVTRGSNTSNDQAESSSSRPVLASPSMNLEVPVSSMKAVNDCTLSNIVKLSLAGLVLCLLGLIVAEHIFFTHCKAQKMTSGTGEEAKYYQVGMEFASPPMPSNISLVLNMPNSNDLDGYYCNISY